jgi:hypothetical protein
VEQKLLTLSSPPDISGVRVTRSLVLYACFVDRCLSFYIFFFWPLCCLFFDIRILIIPLVSSNSSCYKSSTTGATREQELPTLPEYLSSCPVISWVRVVLSVHRFTAFDYSKIFCSFYSLK